MIVLEVVGVLILVALALVVTWMAVVGLIGSTGVVCLKRCRSCGHLHTGWMAKKPAVCLFCEHPWLSRIAPLRIHHLFANEMAPPAPASPTDRPAA